MGALQFMADMSYGRTIYSHGTLVRLLVRTAVHRAPHHRVDAPRDETYHLGGSL